MSSRTANDFKDSKKEAALRVHVHVFLCMINIFLLQGKLQCLTDKLWSQDPGAVVSIGGSLQ